jgi:tetratricopeptide (TPR) repeat protein
VGVSQAREEYSRADVRRILKISENRLRSWEERGLYDRRTEFGFADLIALKTLQKLRENRIPAGRIRDSLVALREKLADIERPLWELRIFSDGRRVAVELPHGRMEALTGQMLFNFEASSLNRVEMLPKPTQLERTHRLHDAELWFRRGLELEEAGAPMGQAIDAYRRALELNPDAAGAWVNLGTLSYRQGELQEAETCYRQALRISPNYALAHFNLGNICEELDRLPEAVNHYQIAIHLQSTYADAHYNLALVFERQGELMLAAKHWRTYLKLDPASPWAGIARQQLRNLVTIMPGGRSERTVGTVAEEPALVTNPPG